MRWIAALIFLIHAHSVSLWEAVAHQEAMAQGLEPALVKAIASQESQWVTGAWRPEPKLERAEFYIKAVPLKDKNNPWAWRSLGLMGITYVAAREVGYTGTPEGLFVPRVNLHYGCKYLKLTIKRYYLLEDVISFWNAGWHEKVNGKYRNQIHVDLVMGFYASYGGMFSRKNGLKSKIKPKEKIK